MFFCAVCAIRFVPPFVKIFIDSGPERSENSAFLSPNTLVANRKGLESMPESVNTKSVSIIAQRTSVRMLIAIRAGNLRITS